MPLLSESIGVCCAEDTEPDDIAPITHTVQNMVAKLNTLFGKDNNDYPPPVYTHSKKFALTSKPSGQAELYTQFDMYFSRWMSAFEDISTIYRTEVPRDGIADTLLMQDIAGTDLFSVMKKNMAALIHAMGMCEYASIGAVGTLSAKIYSEALQGIAFAPLILFSVQHKIEDTSRHGDIDDVKAKILARIYHSISEVARRTKSLNFGNVYLEYLETDNSAEKREAAVFGFKYIFAKWIKVFSIVNCAMKQWIDTNTPIEHIIARTPELFLKTFLIEVPDATSLNRPVKSLASDYVMTMGGFAQIDPRPFVCNKVDMDEFKAALCAGMWITALEKGVPKELLSDVGKMNAIDSVPIWHKAALQHIRIKEEFGLYSKYLLSPDIMPTGGDLRFNGYAHTWNGTITPEFTTAASCVHDQIPVWFFLSIIHNNTELMHLRRITTDMIEKRRLTAMLNNDLLYSRIIGDLSGIKSPQMFFKAAELSKLRISIKGYARVRTRTENAPELLPRHILVLEFTESATVRLPAMLALDEYLIPCLLIPTSPKTCNFLLSAYGVDKNDPLVYPGPFTETIIDTASAAAQKHFTQYCYIGFTIKSMLYLPLRSKSATPIDIRPYLTGTPEETSPRAEDVFTKYQLIAETQHALLIQELSELGG